jgi:hypothetical protein
MNQYFMSVLLLILGTIADHFIPRYPTLGKIVSNHSPGSQSLLDTRLAALDRLVEIIRLKDCEILNLLIFALVTADLFVLRDLRAIHRLGETQTARTP